MQEGQQKHTQDLLKQAITEINRIGNNINQVARDINNRKKLTDKLFNHNLTKEERGGMLEDDEDEILGQLAMKAHKEGYIGVEASPKQMINRKQKYKNKIKMLWLEFIS